jgi:hypothetical protein
MATISAIDEKLKNKRLLINEPFKDALAQK